MRILSIYTLGWVLVTALCLAQSPRQEQETITGRYHIYAAGKHIETDEFRIVQGKRGMDEIKSIAGDRKLEIEVTYENGKLQSYQQTLNGLPGLRATVSSNLISFYENEAMTGALTIGKEMYIFEPTVSSHYWFLLHGYDKISGGKQSIEVVWPSQQDFIKLEIERHGSDGLKCGERKIDAVHYRIAIGRRDQANVWVDGYRIIAIHLVSKNLCMVDAGYEQLHQQIASVLKRGI